MQGATNPFAGFLGQVAIISGKATNHILAYVLQWNLVIKRSDITKPSYNKVVLLVPALYIS